MKGRYEITSRADQDLFDISLLTQYRPIQSYSMAQLLSIKSYHSPVMTD